MRLRGLFEIREMPVADALAVFAKHGIDPRKLSAEELKKATRRLAMKLHPDQGGKPGELSAVNAAFDALKNGIPTPSGQRPSQEPYTGGYSPSSKETAPWAWAGYSGGYPPSSRISTNDYRDMNFIKKRMWELSGKSREEWTIHGFDGYFFRGMLTVYGSRKIFDEMARAMIDWQTKGGNPYHCRAVFVSKKSDGNKLYLIYADGTFYGKRPIEFQHDSFNANPSNDQAFLRSIPGELDQIKANPDQFKPHPELT